MHKYFDMYICVTIQETYKMSDSQMHPMHDQAESYREIAKSHYVFKIIDPGA